MTSPRELKLALGNPAFGRWYGEREVEPSWGPTELDVLESAALKEAATAWEAAMRNPLLVLVGPGDRFRRALCGLMYRAGHKHTFACAGPHFVVP